MSATECLLPMYELSYDEMETPKLEIDGILESCLARSLLRVDSHEPMNMPLSRGWLG